WRAVDVEAILAAHDRFLGDGKWKRVERLAIGALTRVEGGVVIQVAAGHGPFRQRPRGPAIFEELAGPQRNEFWLVLHIMPARRAGGGQRQRHQAEFDIKAQLQTPLWAAAFPETRTSREGRTAGLWLRCTGRTGCARPARSAAH